MTHSQARSAAESTGTVIGSGHGDQAFELIVSRFATDYLSSYQLVDADFLL